MLAITSAYMRPTMASMYSSRRSIERRMAVMWVVVRSRVDSIHIMLFAAASTLSTIVALGGGQSSSRVAAGGVGARRNNNRGGGTTVAPVGQMDGGKVGDASECALPQRLPRYSDTRVDATHRCFTSRRFAPPLISAQSRS